MSDEVKALRTMVESQAKAIASLERAVREMKALARGPKGDDGRDGKDGKDGRDGRDGKVVYQTANDAPVAQASARTSDVQWVFEVDDRGRTIARPMGASQ